MKKHNKFIIGIIVGLILSSVIGYAKTVLTSNEVVYDNTNSKLSSTNVKDAIDELNEKATTKLDEAKQTCPDGYECNKIFTPKYFAFIEGSFTKEELKAKNITDYQEINSSKYVTNFVAALSMDGEVGICDISSGLFCVKAGDYENSITKLKKHFGESSCASYLGYYSCNYSGLVYDVVEDGTVSFHSNGSSTGCAISSKETFSCSS